MNSKDEDLLSSKITNISAINVVTLSWRATKGGVSISSEKKDRDVAPLLAMTQELVRLY